MVGEHHGEPQGEGLASSIQAQMEKEHFENTKVKNIRYGIHSLVTGINRALS